ncbi:hypothetical protein KFE25_014061 [Diacronema lutheri]|uniref:MI domain-containing protein n=2 Tax=Diacronema lutheri TaxID=2081491 RepID=A0A8J5X6Y7_DIALT|nr:hypothetical protein KFE25_014061 [Diacronema lutheri]
MAGPRAVVPTARSGTPTAASRKAQRQQARLEKKSRRAVHAARGRAAPLAARAAEPPADARRPVADARRPRELPAPTLARNAQARRGAGNAPRSNFHRLLVEQGLVTDGGGARGATSASVRRSSARTDDLDAEIDALERKLGMRKKQSAERERRALERDGFGFALELDTAGAARQQRPARASARAGGPAARNDSGAGDGGEEEEEDEEEEADSFEGSDAGEEGADGMTVDRALDILDGADSSGGSSDDEGEREGEGEEEEVSEADGEEEMTLEEALDVLEGVAGDDGSSSARDSSDDDGGACSSDDAKRERGEADEDEDAEFSQPELSAKRKRGARDAPPAAAAPPAARGAYVPPALRTRPAGVGESAQTVALRRALRSGVNRVSSENVDVVTAELVRACAGASRAEVASLLSEAIFAAALSHALVLGPLVLACAALAASLHVRLGMGVGAHLVEALVCRFDALYDARAAKACVNGALLIAHLYNLRVVHCELVYDLVRTMAAGLGVSAPALPAAAAASVAASRAPAPAAEPRAPPGELEVEVLHAMLRAVGAELRNDDPAALKEIVLEVGRRAAEHGGALASAALGGRVLVGAAGETKADVAGARGEAGGGGGEAKGSEASVRMQVLLQLVLDLKNNKQLRARGRDGADDMIARVRAKVLGCGGGRAAGAGGGGGGKKKRARGADGGGSSAAELEAKVELCRLRATWADYASAATNGRWWLVGSAWAGGADGRTRRAGQPADDGGDEDEAREAGSGSVAGEDRALLALARRQGMNTDVRRRIFVAVMGANGHVDACERIAALKLARGPAREVGRVLVECCAQEAAYNPFYAQLGARLCEASSDEAYTLQYAFWDHFKQLASYSVRRISHLARLLGALFGRGALPLAALKGIEFGAMHPQLVLMLQIALIELIAEHDARALERALDKLVVAQSEGARAVVEGLFLFCGAPLERALELRTRAERDALARNVQLLRARLEAAAPLARAGR